MSMTLSLAALATQLGAQLHEGDPEHCVRGVTTLKRATAHEISFFSNRLYREELAQTQAAAVIIATKDLRYCAVPKLVMNNPYLGYALAARLFNPPKPHIPEIHPTAWVSPHAQLHPSVAIGAQAVIEAGAVLAEGVSIGAGCVLNENISIGAHSQLMPNVTLYSNTHIGERCLIHSGAVLGADGFGLANDRGQWLKVPQLGGVVLGDDVEVGANTTIDRGALEDTIIGNGVKLDNQIQIAHNVQIGDHTAIAGCVGIAGSTRIGKHCMIAGGVGIVGHIELADNVNVTGGSVILQSITEPGVYSSGTPLQTNQQWHRNYHRFKQLDELAKRLQQLEQPLKL
ncbi:MAG: UDP-3-O-(3-hydroxymyristoyl)glucosamine N-acyltransferase [Thiotrichaceae bacterium]|nr:UDP-3-O-(3-hydroxymyristoyl)glucosamine N-acyltransferase [Thiotrichaceae bacterium]